VTNAAICLLQMAVETEGSRQALASRLRAPERTLERWMTGARIPYRAYLAVLDFLLDRDRKGELALSWPPDAMTDGKYVIRLGETLAKCASCETTEFRPVERAQLRLTSKLACDRCGMVVEHAVLLASLASELARRP